MIVTMSARTTVLVGLLAAALGACSNDPPILNDAAPIVIDADPGIDAPAPVCSGGTLDYLETCTVGSTDCGSCECHSFGHSVVCTKTCTDNADCPAPSAGCSGGYCRR